ncbi:WD40 repeat domain-containing protein [Candidatus Dependentiae bacterium]|nr:WD40 repeat domain-containing protein [Candidatus Dependentiae bacterium]
MNFFEKYICSTVCILMLSSSVHCMQSEIEEETVEIRQRDELRRAYARAKEWDIKTVIDLPNCRKDILVMEFSADKKTILTECDKRACLFESETGKLIREFEGHIGTIIAGAVGAEGKTIVTSSQDKTVRVWNAHTGKVLRQFASHPHLSDSSLETGEAKNGLTDSLESTGRLWNKDPLRLFKKLFDLIWCVSLSPDERLLFTGSHDGTAWVWDVESGKPLMQLKGHTETIFSAEIYSCGTRILTASSDGTARLWDIKSGNELMKYSGHTKGINSAVVSPCGTMILTGSGDRTAILWNSETGKPIRTFIGHIRISCVSLSFDGTIVLTTGYNDKTVRLWDVNTGIYLRQLQGPRASILAVAFRSDQMAILAASGEGSVHSWSRPSVEDTYTEIISSENCYLDKDTDELGCTLQ